MSRDDAQLVTETLGGDADSFGELVRHYQDAVQAFAYNATGSFEDARDIVQDVFVLAYRRLNQLKKPERFGAWLRRITQNQCRMWYRQRGIDAAATEALTQELSSASAASPEMMVEREERNRFLRAAFAGLSDKNRLVLTLFYMNDWTHREIADFLGVPVTTVVGRLHRARRQLRGRLEPMVRERFQSERLSDDFARNIVAEAIRRADEARERWEKEAFFEASREALEALGRLPDDREAVKGRIEILTHLGEAESTWAGEPEHAVRDYEAALVLARKEDDREEEAAILRALAETHLRHGRFDIAQEVAQKACERYAEVDDPDSVALTAAFGNLAARLPGRWTPGDAGGYVAACLPIRVDDGGIRFLEPTSVRHLTWGRPSPSIAFARLLYPPWLLGPDTRVGASWSETITDRTGHNVLWPPTGKTEYRARSTIVADEETVVTPAGRFENCLRVETEIAPPDGRIAPRFIDRSHCGTRTVWIAPGAGVVKLRFEGQEGHVRTIALAAFSVKGGNDTLPLIEGNEWRYRWMPLGHSYGIYEDTIRVVVRDEADAYLDAMVACERDSADPLGEATFLFEKATRLDEEDREGRMRCFTRQIELYEALPDERRLLDARWHRILTDHELTPEEDLEWRRAQRALAHRSGNWFAKARAIQASAHATKTIGRTEEAIELMEEAAVVALENGAVRDAVHPVAYAERWRLEAERPPTDTCGYAYGDQQIIERDGTLSGGGSTRTRVLPEPWPPGATDRPQNDLSMHGPLAGLDLLTKGEIETVSSSNIGTDWGTETIRSVVRVAAQGETVEVAAGRFDGCTRIEATATGSMEPRGENPERDVWLGYTLGMKRLWFKRGVGLTRLVEDHQNGERTEIELVRFDLAEPSDSYFPLARGNRWAYRWMDVKNGILYEDFWRVLGRDGEAWTIVFVTRTTRQVR